jgi:hypothetical protein
VWSSSHMASWMQVPEYGCKCPSMEASARSSNIMSMCFSMASRAVLDDQERRAKRSRASAGCVSMSLICFRCFRTRSHVSDSREFQNYPLLAEGFHVFDCTWTIAEGNTEPPAVLRRHEPGSFWKSIASWCSLEPLNPLCIRSE